MTVLVTGATGFIGGHLVDLLLGRNEPVRVLARPAEDLGRLVRADVDVCHGGLTDRSSLAAAVRGVDRIIHCAARTGPWGAETEYTEVNVVGTQALLEASLEARVTRFVHVSSITVHGANVKGTADETAALNPGPDPYSRTKAEAERMLRRTIESSGAPVTIVRPGVVYGPRDMVSFARFAQLIEHGRMPIIGSGHNHVPLIHVSDVARGLAMAAEAPHAAGRAYLLVNDQPVTQLEYFAAIADELGVPRPRLHVPYVAALALGVTSEAVGHVFGMRDPPPVMRFGIRQIAGENRFLGERAHAELGFAPKVRLRDGVRQAVAWYRAEFQSVRPKNAGEAGNGNPGYRR
jgi:nucleoside-diphosphate-sugar epimerase